MNTETPFEQFLNQHDEEGWSATLATLMRSVHEVDRSATQIWFSFYPLSLFRALQDSDDREKLARQLLLQGRFELKDQIDTSHAFLYGHRFWPHVKEAVERHAQEWQTTQFVSGETIPAKAHATSLADQVLAVADTVAQKTKKDKSLLVGITAIAFMTMQQTGFSAFQTAPGAVTIDNKLAHKSPERVRRERAKDGSQGLFGFLKTINRLWTVTWDENDSGAKYKLREGQDLAWGAASDQSREWTAIDPRRIEGPIPVECRSASCGTCWVGVLGGAERLSDVGAREGKKIKEFGYIDSGEPKPLIRLACQARAEGAVSIVIPPWNGQFGKYLRSLKADESATMGQPEKTRRAEENRTDIVN